MNKKKIHNKHKDSFIKSYPGLPDLINKLNIDPNNKKVWISLEQEYQIINSLLFMLSDILKD